MSVSYRDIAKMIDHALLKPDATFEELEAGIDLALAYDVAGVCILPHYLRTCTERLRCSTVKPSTVIGFPHGAHTTDVKVAEAIRALDDGGEELDMVVNISRVKSGDWEYVSDEIRAVIAPAHERDMKVKVIFETCYLNDEQRIRLCEICGDAGADWVKTSTGFGNRGATHADLRLMRAHVPDGVQVKASGGIRTLDALLDIRELGVTRVGTSSTKAILDECKRRLAET